MAHARHGLRRAHASAHLRGTDDWERLDPGHVQLIEHFGAPTTRRADVMAAIDACHDLNVRLVDLFHRVPLLLTPDRGRPARPDRRAGHRRTARRRPRGSSFTYPFNMTRSPAGTVCVGLHRRRACPSGLQVVGPQHADVVVLRALALLEDALAIDRVAPV